MAYRLSAVQVRKFDFRCRRRNYGKTHYIICLLMSVEYKAFYCKNFTVNFFFGK